MRISSQLNSISGKFANQVIGQLTSKLVDSQTPAVKATTDTVSFTNQPLTIGDQINAQLGKFGGNVNLTV